MSTDPPTSDVIRQAFDEVRALLPEFAAARVIYRQHQPVSRRILDRLPLASKTVPASGRDRAVVALGNKAANTHQAIRLLADSGHGSDATALSRVLLETLALLRWMLAEDSVYRLDLYCISDALRKRRLLQMVEQHYPDRPEVLEAARAGVSQATLDVASYFGNVSHDWLARLVGPDGTDEERLRIKDLFTETGGESPSSFAYDIVYFDQSADIHSSVSSLATFNGQLVASPFASLEFGPQPARCDVALLTGNLTCAAVLESVADYLGLSDIRDRAAAIIRAIQAGRLKPPRD